MILTTNSLKQPTLAYVNLRINVKNYLIVPHGKPWSRGSCASHFLSKEPASYPAVLQSQCISED